MPRGAVTGASPSNATHRERCAREADPQVRHLKVARRATQPREIVGTPGGIRTTDPQVRSLMPGLCVESIPALAGVRRAQGGSYAVLAPSPETRTPGTHEDSGGWIGSGGRIRTCDLRVMSPPSYQTAPPRNEVEGQFSRVRGGVNAGAAVPVLVCCVRGAPQPIGRVTLFVTHGTLFSTAGGCLCGCGRCG